MAAKESKTEFVARPYQVEILETSKTCNTIVCLGTGTGKTFISVMLIKDKQGGICGTLAEEGKRTVFLVNTVPLVEQQRHVIIDHTSLKVGHYTGDMAVDFWKKKRWEKEFDEHDVLVMTAQILLNILNHSFFSLRNINLLILDECHNASGKHPYNSVLEFYKTCPPKHHPHLMGLTASIINEKYKKSTNIHDIKLFLQHKMRDLESRMRSRCLTCSDPQSTARYATKPKESVVAYKSGYSLNSFTEVKSMIDILDADLQKLEEKIKLTKRSKHQMGRSSSRDIDFDLLLSNAYSYRFKDACDIAIDATKYCKDVLSSLGPLCAYEAAKILLEQLEKHQEKRFGEQDILKHCCTVFNRIILMYTHCATSIFPTVDHVLPIQPFVTAKLHMFLTDILLEQKRYYTEQGTDLHAIVFVQRRCTAVILSKLINFQVQADFNTFFGIWSDYVLGHGLDANIRLADSFMKSKEQNTILNRFKKGEFNVLVATSVVEEGLDVHKCNLVVRFDGINNYREYAQSKGRARAVDSKFIIMAQEENKTEMEIQHQVMKTIEEVLFEHCQDRSLPTDDEIRQALYDEEEELIPTFFATGEFDSARISRNTAVPLLYLYCQKLPCDKYASTVPYFEDRKRQNGVSDAFEFQMDCRLPLNCPLPQKCYQSPWMTSKDLAKKKVAMEICQKLYEINELDDNLLPVQNITDESDDEDDNVVDEGKKKRDYYIRKIPNELSGQFSINDSDLYAISIVLTDPSDRPTAIPYWGLWYKEKVGFGILLPRGLSKLPSFKLYTKAGGLTVKFIKLNKSPEFMDYKDSIKKFHQFVIDTCCKKYVSGKLEFNLNDARSVKGLFVLLNSSVFAQIDAGLTVQSREQLDFVSMFQCFDQDVMDCDIKDFANSIISKTYLDENQNKRMYYVLENSLKTPGDIMEGTKTFAKYYQERYGRVVNPNQFLIKVVPCVSKTSFADNHGESKKNSSREELLIPELCGKVGILSVDVHSQIQILPYVMYKLEYLLSAKQLQQNISSKLRVSSDERKSLHESNLDDGEFTKLANMLLLENTVNVGCQSPSVMDIMTSITTRRAHFGFDLERLEMLGDSFLKQAVSIFLYFKFPDRDEGRLSSKRKAVIRNENLYRIAKKCEIQHIICNSNFGNVDKHANSITNKLSIWLPPGYVRNIYENEDQMELINSYQQYPYQEVPDKSLADCIEALIGVYFKTGGVSLALKFMQEYLCIDVLFAAIAEQDQCKVKLSTQSSYADYPAAESAIINPNATNDILMKLYNKGKLDRFEEIINYDFKDKSFLVQAMTHLSYSPNNVTGCYQQLEFLGDSILDFLVTLHVYNNNPSLSPGKLTSIRSALVNNNTFALLAIKNQFYKYLYQESPALFSAYDTFVTLVMNDGEENALNHVQNPFVVVRPGSNEGYNAPKVLGDLFESVAGAIFLDSSLNLMEVWRVFYPIMKEVIDDYMERVPLNPKRELMEKYQDVEWSFESNSNITTCTATFGVDKKKAKGIGQNKKIAQATACVKALQMIKID